MEMPTSHAHGRFGIYEVKPMKVMPPRKKGKKIQRGWVAPKKRRKNARGESRHTPEISRGCVGGAIRGVIFFCYHEDRLTRKNRFLLGWERRDGGIEEKGEENPKG